MTLRAHADAGALVRLTLFALLGAASQPSVLHAQDSLPAGHAPVSDEALARALGEGPPVAESAPSATVPAGTVDVLVVDEHGAPVPRARVRLGTMANGANGDQRFANTDASGHARFTGLTGAARTAHRVTLDHEGARYLTTPFMLAPNMGQAATIRRLPTSRDMRVLLQRIGQTIVEFQKPGRLHISQQAELINLGERTLVFGSGLAVPLPEGFLAFESEASMNDQRIVPNDRGFTINGSLPPGRLQLRWTYDIPFTGSEVTVRQRVPFHQTAAYQLIVDANAGMQLDVRGFPDARFVDYQGKNLLVAERELTPEEPPMTELRYTIAGIPGPGPYRWIAIALAVLGVAWGLRLAATRGGADAIAREERARRSSELLHEIERLAAEHAAGDVGDAFFTRERERITEELALLAKHDAEASVAPLAASPAPA